MPCSCFIARSPPRAKRNLMTKTRSQPVASADLSDAGANLTDGCRNTASGASSVPCYHCLCTVCGQDHHDVPTVTCHTCGSHTHITCARDAYSKELLRDQILVVSPTVAAAVGAAGAISGRTSTKGMRKRRAQEPRPGATPSEAQAVALGSHEATGASAELSPSPLLCCDGSPSGQKPSPQPRHPAAIHVDKSFIYYCHPDCAMGMEVMPNPQFSAALSQSVEGVFASEWERVQAGLMAAGIFGKGSEEVKTSPVGPGETSPPGKASVGNENSKMNRPKSATPLASFSASAPTFEDSCRHDPPGSAALDLPSLLQSFRWDDTGVSQEVVALYHQLRAEAWGEYFERERHHCGHPLFYPPPFLDTARDAAASYVLEAASPQGQAARLFLLDPSTHPVGSYVAIPVGVLTRWQQSASAAPIVKPNEANNFVAESLEKIVLDAVPPEMTVTHDRRDAEGPRSITTNF